MPSVNIARAARGLITTTGVVLLIHTAGTASAKAISPGAGATTRCLTVDPSAVCDLDAVSGAAPDVSSPKRTTPLAQRDDTVEQSLQALIDACRSTYIPPRSFPVSIGNPKGGWYFTPCAGELGTPSQVVGPLSFIPDSAISTSTLDLALQARRELTLPTPAISSSPGPAAQTPKVVNLPTWAWIDNTAWTPMTATASVPGVSVTATATPLYVNWSFGDGDTAICRGPGTPYTPTADPATASPDCGHTYQVTSKTAPRLRFPVTATIHWRITWRASTGSTGQFPNMTSHATQAWPVEEIDALALPPRAAS